MSSGSHAAAHIRRRYFCIDTKVEFAPAWRLMPLFAETGPRTPDRAFARYCKILLVVWTLGIYLPYNLISNEHTKYGETKPWSFCFPTADYNPVLPRRRGGPLRLVGTISTPSSGRKR